MTKIISLIDRTQKKDETKNSFLEHMVKGTPYTVNVFGKKIEMIGTFYKIKKQREFFEGYYPHFLRTLEDIHPNQEFDITPTVLKYNTLSDLEKMNIGLECSQIYAFNNKLTYADFIDIVDDFIKYENKDSDFDFSGNNIA